MALKLTRGDTILVEQGATYWFYRTDAEVAALREADQRDGRLYDAGGEPVIYSSVGCSRAPHSALGIVTRLKGIEWPTWGRRPKHLVECILTLDGVPKYVLVRSDRVKKMLGDGNDGT